MEEKTSISFSQAVKKEILSADNSAPCCAHAAAYGMACFARTFDETGLVLHTETTAVAQLAKKLFAELGISGKIYVRGTQEARIYEFAVKEPPQIERMLEVFGHEQKMPSLRINSKNFVCEHCVGSFTAGAFLACGTMSRAKAFAVGVFSGAMEPLFGVLTVLALSLVVPYLPWLLAFAAGAMMYVVVEELIPAAHLTEHSDLGTLSVMAGFVVMMLLDTTLG